MQLIPPPPAAARKPVAVYDTECFPNYWLLKFRTENARILYAFRLFAGQAFSVEEAGRIRLLFELFTTVSFNGIYYDVPMITAAISGYTCEQLKWLNDRIIPKQIKGQPKVYGAKPWELGLPDWKPADHIDIMEVAPGAGSLKQYGGRIHSKKLRDLPYDPDHYLTPAEAVEVDLYCDNDLDLLEDVYKELAPQLRQREVLSDRYGIDLRSKSDAQVAETVIKKRCEQALGQRIYKPEIDWNLRFRYKTPDFIAYQSPQLQRALSLVQESIFTLDAAGTVAMPPQLENLAITIGSSVYKMGIGGLHSQEEKLIAVSNETHQVRMPDVDSYYPSLMLNSGEFPPALGRQFLTEFEIIKDERLAAKALAKKLKKEGLGDTPEYEKASTEDGGGKIQINGTFGKTGSPYSVLFAPTMLIQTTLTGQLSILMLIEWHEHYGIPVISANTDGIVINCPRDKLRLSEALIAEWEKRTGLKMSTDDYVAIYARDVNTYFAIKTPDDVKRKGEYAKSGLIEKKNPDVEICSDAVAEYLAKGVPIEQTIVACQDIRKFVTIQKVNGGGVKMWGEGARKNTLVRDMVDTLTANGWSKVKLQSKIYLPDGSPQYSTTKSVGWVKNGCDPIHAADAYASCFEPQRPEYLGKVVRWYYGTRSPGPIVYATNGNTVSLSYGATPCMTLPDAFPDDIDYEWYINKAKNILLDIGK
jgi:hypothetical protein